MHQSFELRGDPAAGERHLPLLRAAMREMGIDGLLVPHDDEYLNEYTPEAFERLRWATGFSGSAGVLLLMAETALLFVDGRYTEQARLETAPGLFEFDDLRNHPPEAWLRENPGRVQRLGYAASLHTRKAAAELERLHAAGGPKPVPLEQHPVDALWRDRPAADPAPLAAHPLEFAGEASADKRARLAAKLAAAGADATVFCNPNAVAWLLNLRGADVAHTPVPLCRAVLQSDGRTALFLRGHAVDAELRAHLGDAVEVLQETDFSEYLAGLGRSGACVLLDPATCPDAVHRVLKDAGATIREGEDPLPAMRAVKNAAEIDGARRAHVRDGVAMVRFLRWFDAHKADGLTEIDVVRRLEAFRADSGALREISFDTIAGAGPNGAIIHYRVSEASNRRIEPGDLLLLDSGAQYDDGTTDITRTLAVGPQSDERRDRYTRVLKGHIALSRAVFPPDTAGFQLDLLAREPLWQAGLDYAHGTGHGVGAFLGVHEGPHGIAKRGAPVPLQAGMLVTNEPGYYRPGDYGIRIENILVVREAKGMDGMLEFEPLTMTPIETALIERELLTAEEVDWLDRYHAQVRAALSPHLVGADADWLEAATRPLG